MSEVKKVLIDPACDILYSSFFIKGLFECFGKSNVVFSSAPFRDLRYDNENFLLAFIIDGVRYVIDTTDFNTLRYPDFLEWANVYGKVNFNKNHIPAKYADKVIPISPNFGVPMYGNNKYINAIVGSMRYIQCRSRLDYGFMSYLARYIRLKDRMQDISLNEPEDNFVFFVSRFWAGQDDANNARINFVRACKRLQLEGLIKFEGGLVPDVSVSDCPDDVKLDHEIPIRDYNAGLKKSMLVFNTPAYHHCHGWKLPEFMVSGCAILSTPFVNELPYNLNHKESIYFSNSDEESLYLSIKDMVENNVMRNNMRQNIRRIWNEYAKPTMAIKYFINNKTQ